MEDPFSEYNQSAEDEYIDIDLRSPAIFCCSISSPDHTQETTISTADELFCSENLLPLRLPHCMQKEKKLQRGSETVSKDSQLHVASIESEHEKSWSKKLKGIGQSLLKLKISKAYFSKSISSVKSRNLASKSVPALSLSSVSSSSFSCVSRSSHMLKRSSSMSSEMESSVMGAIAYCKKTQQICGRKGECR
ncbi:probable membrane-associated kinase regulator 4 [Phalaenopsis equestris]|uniref:probable membrane-associated kinase regulator 4 n=1 Tax=Phalaenopsis equestris TaxID=78828 RepID=UPI0009E5A0A2|nr:probable membrane-associated kinase regulator 4 [Phalaenopsis equestris]